MNMSLRSASSLEALYSQLHSSANGLTNAQARENMKRGDWIPRQESHFHYILRLFIRQFTSPLVVLLIVAVLLSAILGEVSETFIILFILLVSGLLSFWQELSAGRAAEKLQRMIEMKHTVLRDGHQIQIITTAIVPGDVIFFDAGDVIPADCRLIESNELFVNESALTGESFPVEKEPALVADDTPLSKKYNCLWQGTNVISGNAKALVAATGTNTVFGNMAHSLIQITETSFEKGIQQFGYFLLRITVIISIFILLVNLYLHKPFFDSLLFSLALAVGMAPELLPAIMTFSMSASARRMSAKKVIVKKLSAIFNFGEINLLCTDKTGTITQGQVVVKSIVDVRHEPDEQARLYACLNARFQKGFTNPIDEALSALPLSTSAYKKCKEIPYDFIRKRLSVAVEKDGQRWMITKGAFDNVLETCSLVLLQGTTKPIDTQTKAAINKSFTEYSRQGYRVMGLAYKEIVQAEITRADEKDLTFMGFILLEDPLKEDAIASITRLKELNIDFKIITGDNQFAASHIAEKLGIKNPVLLTGATLDKLPPDALIVKARETEIFAEIEPHQKERIIKALQRSHFSVAYMGDGINDVAAIHAADIGISTNNAVAVAKEAADIVLLKKNLSVLADGIVEGRKSFANSMKYIFITTGATFGNMFSVAGASFLLPFLPMLPKQILLNNLITDLPFITIASDHVEEAQLQLPGKWNMRLIRNFMIVFGLHSSIFDFLTFYILYYHFHLTAEAFQTGWFMESAITELLIIFVIRTAKPLFKSRPSRLLLITSLLAFILIILLPFLPFAPLLSFSIAHTQQVIAISVILLAYLVTADLLKLLFFRYQHKKSGGKI